MSIFFFLFVKLLDERNLLLCENYNANSLNYHASKKKLIIVVCWMARKLKDKKEHCGMQVQTFNLYMLIRKYQELMKDLSACFILPHKSPQQYQIKESAEDGVLSACSLADRKGQCAKTNSRHRVGMRQMRRWKKRPASVHSRPTRSSNDSGARFDTTFRNCISISEKENCRRPRSLFLNKSCCRY